MKKTLFLLSLTLLSTTAFSQFFPLLENDSIQTLENTAITFDVRSNDDSITYSLSLCDYPFFMPGPFTSYEGGTWAILPGDSLQYTPPIGFTGQDWFHYAICGPGGGQTDTARVVITVLPGPISLPADSVWPGDANYDGVANNQDLLAIGLKYAYVGPPRPNASLNWVAQASPDWGDTLANGVDIKHLDTDGDSLILAADTLAILQNYGLTHNKGEQSHSGPLLYLTFTEDSILAGDTATVLVQLGQDTALAQNMYGLAFSINYDTSLVDANSIAVSYQNSWLGDKGTDMLTLHKNFPQNSFLDMALTRTNQQNQSGFGEIARIRVIMVDDLTAKTNVAKTLWMGLSNIYAISVDESEIALSSQAGSVVVFAEEQNNTALEPDWFRQVKVFPNPTAGLLQVQLEKMWASQLELLDLAGRTVYHMGAQATTYELNLNYLPPGVYLLRLETEKGVFQEKVILR
jgi:hypothetical protein